MPKIDGIEFLEKSRESNADVPIIQMSLDYYQGPQYHYELAQELASLRDKGILFVGSGNMVHNLRMVSWQNINNLGYGFDWALKMNDSFKELISSGAHDRLIKYENLGRESLLSIPTPEHYLPLLYTLALQGSNDKVSFFNDKAVAGSLTMTSVKIAQ